MTYEVYLLWKDQFKEVVSLVLNLFSFLFLPRL
jgi:hypothetical protein